MPPQPSPPCEEQAVSNPAIPSINRPMNHLRDCSCCLIFLMRSPTSLPLLRGRAYAIDITTTGVSRREKC